MAFRNLVPFVFTLLLPGCSASIPTPRAVPTEATSATDLYRRGREAAAQGDTVRAEQYLSMALERGFDERKVLPILLRVCLSSNRLRAALNHAEAYLRGHPDDESLRYLIATVRLSLGQIEQARIDLLHLLYVNPNNADAHFLLGVVESAGAHPGRASAHFRTYLELAPDGEHAPDVNSRLTDLAVGTDQSAFEGVHEETPTSERVVRHPVSTTRDETGSRSSTAWFEGATDAKTANEGE